MSFTLAELAVRFGCPVQGDPETTISSVGTLAAARPDSITFLANSKYRKYLAATNAAAVVLTPVDADSCPVPALISDNPYALYARIAGLLHPQPDAAAGEHPSAVVASDARIADSAIIGPNAVVEENCVIGERVVVGPGCVVGRNSSVGNDSRLVANVTVGHNVQIGQRALIHPGAVVGSDGFGFAKEDTVWLKVPQLGAVRVGNDVEIGASTTIDRGAIDDTVIEDGVKLDNQIQVGHNVCIGAHTIIAACSGISGSTRIGQRCMIAGMVGFVGHLEIADDVAITGLTMISRSISQPGVYSGGLPADEAVRWRKNSARFKQLDELSRTVKALEKAIGNRKKHEHKK